MGDYDILDLNTFVVFGYLQEANRLFFHPLGLALQVIQEGRPRLRVIDARDDPEGVVFERLDGEAEKKRAVRVAERAEEKGRVRVERWGWTVQPVGSVMEKEDE